MWYLERTVCAMKEESWAGKRLTYLYTSRYAKLYATRSSGYAISALSADEIYFWENATWIFSGRQHYFLQKAYACGNPVLFTSMQGLLDTCSSSNKSMICLLSSELAPSRYLRYIEDIGDIQSALNLLFFWKKHCLELQCIVVPAVCRKIEQQYVWFAGHCYTEETTKPRDFLYGFTEKEKISRRYRRQWGGWPVLLLIILISHMICSNFQMKQRARLIITKWKEWLNGWL